MHRRQVGDVCVVGVQNLYCCATRLQLAAARRVQRYRVLGLVALIEARLE